MKDLAMNTKLIVRPIVGCLTHSHFWEGPCRAGYREDMTVEAESAAADQAFEAAKKVLEGAAEEIHFLEAVDARYDEKFNENLTLRSSRFHAGYRRHTIFRGRTYL